MINYYSNKKEYSGTEAERAGFIKANVGDTFYAIDSKKFYIFYNNQWNLSNEFCGVDGGNAES